MISVAVAPSSASRVAKVCRSACTRAPRARRSFKPAQRNVAPTRYCSPAALQRLAAGVDEQCGAPGEMPVREVGAAGGQVGVEDRLQRRLDRHRAGPAALPYVLDDATVNRVLEVFSGPAEDLWLFEEQVRRWAALDLGATQRRGVQALRAKVERLREATTAVLALAAQLREGTIERVLAKSDIELGLDALLDQRRRQS
jgi:hypothetical protein